MRNSNKSLSLLLIRLDGLFHASRDAELTQYPLSSFAVGMNYIIREMPQSDGLLTGPGLDRGSGRDGPESGAGRPRQDLSYHPSVQVRRGQLRAVADPVGTFRSNLMRAWAA